MSELPGRNSAISNRARAIVKEEIDAPEIVRNSLFPTAYHWLKFIELWAGGAVAEPRGPGPYLRGD